jgi:hypothetical protein
VVLVIIGALFNRVAPVLWVIAVLSTLTVNFSPRRKSDRR